MIQNFITNCQVLVANIFTEYGEQEDYNNNKILSLNIISWLIGPLKKNKKILSLVS